MFDNNFVTFFNLGCYTDDTGTLVGADVGPDGTCQNTAYYNFAWNIVSLIAICLWVSTMVAIVFGIYMACGLLRYKFYHEFLNKKF